MSLMSSSGTSVKVLDVERTPSGTYQFSFNDVDGYEKLTAKNFSILSLTMRTHAEHGNYGPTEITSYDNQSGTLTLTGTPYTSCTGGTFRITFGDFE